MLLVKCEINTNFVKELFGKIQIFKKIAAQNIIRFIGLSIVLTFLVWIRGRCERVLASVRVSFSVGVFVCVSVCGFVCLCVWVYLCGVLDYVCMSLSVSTYITGKMSTDKISLGKCPMRKCPMGNCWLGNYHRIHRYTLTKYPFIHLWLETL